MNKRFLPFLIIATVMIAVIYITRADVTALTALTIKIENLHNVGTIRNPGSIAVVENDSVYIKEIELKGNWKLPESGSAPFPWQAFQWFTDPAGDSPFKLLNWAGITFDTTWVKTVFAPDSVRFSIPERKPKCEWKNGKWTLSGGATNVGWMDTTQAYYIDVYAVRTSGDTLVKTLNFEGVGTKNFTEAVYELKYIATGYGNDTLLTSPNYLASGEASFKIQLKNGSSALAFPIVAGMDSLKFMWRNSSGVFFTEKIKIEFPSANILGLVPTVNVVNVPGSGFFSAGDTIHVNIVLQSDSGVVLDWQTQAAALGIQKVEVLLSGPKRDYMRVSSLQNVVNNYIVQTYPTAAWSGMPAGTAFSNPIKIVIPADSLNKFGTGTYTIYISAKRIYGATIELAARKDIQIGTTTVDPIIMASNISGQSCASCHGLNGPAKHHGSKGYEDCAPCHTDNMSQQMYKIVHVKHFKSTNYTADLGDCNACHLNQSANTFTDDANVVCQSCHVKVPYLSSAHQTAIPLYATSGLSCATANCHAGGGLGVYKNNTETHAGLAAKYAGGTVTAKKTDVPIVIDGTPDSRWSLTDSITTVLGIKLKFLYDDSTLYAYATWLDGHREYPTGVVAPSKSEFRKRWSYDGTTWTQSGDEDRLAITWKMADNFGASCGRTCHNESNPHATKNDKMDVWHWKAQRTNPIYLVDDQYWSTSGRQNDAVISGSFGSDNISSGLPAKMGPDLASNQGPWLLNSTAIPFVNSGWVAGDKIPGYVLNDSPNPIVGSRGDVIAKGVFNEVTGYWTLEMARKLNTGNTDDFVVDLVNGNFFTIARFDNVGSDHARQGVDIGIYKIIYSPDIVPVELSSFTASVRENLVTLSWQTATETNNKGFEIQRQNGEGFQTIAFINGKGNSTQPTSYSFKVSENKAGKFIYRLKQIDFDGSVNYSKEVEAVVAPSDFAISQNYPNPFNPSTVINYQLSQKSKVELKVYDMIGKEIATLVNDVQDAGYYKVNFDASNLASGVYFYRIQAGKFTETKRMILIK